MAGSEEVAPLATVKSLAESGAPAAPRSIIVNGRGAPFDVVARRPDLVEALAGFLLERLASPAGSSGDRSR